MAIRDWLGKWWQFLFAGLSRLPKGSPKLFAGVKVVPQAGILLAQFLGLTTSLATRILEL
jgi:hypothetical protein